MPLTDAELIEAVKNLHPDQRDLHVLGDNIIGKNELKQTCVTGKDIAEAHAKATGCCNGGKCDPAKPADIKPGGITGSPTGSK